MFVYMLSFQYCWLPCDHIEPSSFVVEWRRWQRQVSACLFWSPQISLAVMSAQNIWDTFRVTICYTYQNAGHAHEVAFHLGKGTMLTASLRRSAFSWPGNLTKWSMCDRFKILRGDEGTLGRWWRQTWWGRRGGWGRHRWGWSTSTCGSRCRTKPRCRCRMSRLCSRLVGGRTGWHCMVPPLCRTPFEGFEIDRLWNCKLRTVFSILTLY